jgi:hypothetical protein
LGVVSYVCLTKVVAGKKFDCEDAKWCECGEAEFRKDRLDLLLGEDGESDEVTSLRSGSYEDAGRRRFGDLGNHDAVREQDVALGVAIDLRDLGVEHDDDLSSGITKEGVDEADTIIDSSGIGGANDDGFAGVLDRANEMRGGMLYPGNNKWSTVAALRGGPAESLDPHGVSSEVIFVPHAKLVGPEGEEFEGFGRDARREGQEVVEPLGVGGGAEELGHGVDPGGIVTFSWEDAADWFGVDRQRRGNGFGQWAGHEIYGKQGVRAGRENAGEVGVVRVSGRLIELDPEEALAGFGGTVGGVVLKG